MPASVKPIAFAALATLGAVILAEAPGVAADGQKPQCTAQPAPAGKVQQQSGAATTSGSATQSAPDGRGAPGPVGTVPADFSSNTAPAAAMTIAGSDPAATESCPSPAPSAATVKSHKTRSNIQNN